MIVLNTWNEITWPGMDDFLIEKCKDCCVDIILDEYNYLIFWHEKNETSV